MSDLSPQARAFLDAHADEGLPSNAERERVRAAALAAIAPQLPPSPTPTSAPAPAAVGVAKLVGAVVIAAGLIAGLTLWTRGEDPAPTRARAPTPPVATEPAPLVLEKPEAAPLPLPPANTPIGSLRRPTVPAPPTVAEPAPTPEPAPQPAPQEVDPAEEFQMLAQAQASTRAGNPAWALELLEQHQRRFGSKSLLQEEALAARVMAQCGLGQATGAKATAAQLRSLNPASVHLSKIERACW